MRASALWLGRGRRRPTANAPPEVWPPSLLRLARGVTCARSPSHPATAASAAASHSTRTRAPLDAPTLTPAPPCPRFPPFDAVVQCPKMAPPWPRTQRGRGEQDGVWLPHTPCSPARRTPNKRLLQPLLRLPSLHRCQHPTPTRIQPSRRRTSERTGSASKAQSFVSTQTTASGFRARKSGRDRQNSSV